MMETKQQSNDFLGSIVAYASSMLALIAIRIIFGFGLLDDVPDQPLELGFSLVSQLLVMFVLPFFVFRYMKAKTKPRAELLPSQDVIEKNSKQSLMSHLGFKKISPKFVALSLLLGILLYFMNIFVSSFSYTILDGMGYRFPSGGNVFPDYWGLLLSLVLVAVLPGLCEEFTHRGVLLTGLRSKLGNYRAVIAVSILFGLMHMNIAQFFYATVLGWFICVSVMASGSLWTGIIIHFTNNAINTYTGYAEEIKNLPLGNLIYDLLGYVNNFIFIFVLIIAIYMAVGAILKSMARENFLKNKTAYVAKYLEQNPDAYKAFDSVTGQTVTFERVTAAVEKTLERMSSWKAVFAYIENHERPKKLLPLEKAIFISLFVLSGLITVFTLHWGLL